MLRRTFLKTATALVGGVLAAKYLEPLTNISQIHNDWIEDKGDYYIVRIPDNSIFSNEILDKPTIFVTGAYVALKRLEITGFVNIIAKGPISVMDSMFDASKSVSLNDSDRPVIRLDMPNSTGDATLDTCRILGNTVQKPRAIDMVQTGKTNEIYLLPQTNLSQHVSYNALELKKYGLLS